jgi:hypothetical protein
MDPVPFVMGIVVVVVVGLALQRVLLLVDFAGCCGQSSKKV